MTSVSFQLSQDRANRSQKALSNFRSFGRRCRRFRTASCRRRTRFSSASSERSFRAVVIRESSRRIVSIIAGRCRTQGHGKATPASSAWWKARSCSSSPWASVVISATKCSRSTLPLPPARLLKHERFQQRSERSSVLLGSVSMARGATLAPSAMLEPDRHQQPCSGMSGNNRPESTAGNDRFGMSGDNRPEVAGSAHRLELAGNPQRSPVFERRAQPAHIRHRFAPGPTKGRYRLQHSEVESECRVSQWVARNIAVRPGV